MTSRLDGGQSRLRHGDGGCGQGTASLDGLGGLDGAEEGIAAATEEEEAIDGAEDGGRGRHDGADDGLQGGRRA